MLRLIVRSSAIIWFACSKNSSMNIIIFLGWCVPDSWRCSWCIFVSVSFFAWYCGLRIVVGEVFSGKKFECGHLDKYWSINRDYCLGYLCVLAKFPLAKDSVVHGRSLSQTQTLWNAHQWWAGSMLWKSLLQRLSCIPEHRTQTGFPFLVLRFHLRVTAS